MVHGVTEMCNDASRRNGEGARALVGNWRQGSNGSALQLWRAYYRGLPRMLLVACVAVREAATSWNSVRCRGVLRGGL
jgi:hypothetical protein